MVLLTVVACSTEPVASRSTQAIPPTATAFPATVDRNDASPPTMNVDPSPTATIPPAATATSTPSLELPTSTAVHEPPSEVPESPTVPPAPSETRSVENTILNEDPDWNQTIRTLDGGFVGVVTSPELNIRAQPSLDSKIVGSTFERHTVVVYELVFSPGDGGQWYRVGPDRYVSAWYVEPFEIPAPEETYRGHWVDVNLSSFYAIAYVDDTPVNAVVIAAGRDGRTPLGEYHVFYRVRDETMDSATIGIPEGDPEHYYLENVEYTQYFKDDGFAIHGNYWTPPSQFGQFASNGCIGMLNADAAWFWDFLDEGSMINIHF